MWEQMKTFELVVHLASFTILLLDLVANQAPNERSFSVLKIKKTHLRNRLGTKKLEKISKLGADIHAENFAEKVAAALIHKRAVHIIHDPTKVLEKPRPKQFMREVLMMELLAAEESGEEPDDRARSGLGDDFEL
ncbi:hypothetical protein B0H17DRAFT_1147314 [Mycena rosella]|uniref:HAT C-terminal dimerisation domain-containing protein n=1 Tax=Mycena rosella TaxID=1033263 RepID=A0AAD7CMN4_MYCRO|nr:hypothetical protein B0H17DRAFT_1147314 [Mycena rosella]